MKRAAIASEQREKAVEQRDQLIQENQADQEEFERKYKELRLFIAEQAQLLEGSINNVAHDIVLKTNTIEERKINEENGG
eukprot:2859217-Ditylum_brightwellii.AAC.1